MLSLFSPDTPSQKKNSLESEALAKIAWLDPGLARGVEEFVDRGLDPLLLFLKVLELLLN